MGNQQNMWKDRVYKLLASLIDLSADAFGQQVAQGFHCVDGCALHPLHMFDGHQWTGVLCTPLHMFDGQSSTNSEILHDCPRASQRATIFGISSAFVEISWSLRGISLDPLKNELVVFMALAAQCEIPPHIAQYLVEIVSQRGVSHPFALFS